MKRKRIKGNGILMAWSNGERVHLPSQERKEMENEFYRQWSLYAERVAQGYEWDSSTWAVLRGESQLMEEYADRLWVADRHVEGLNWLMRAATHLIDWDSITIDCDTNYHHPNLARFRHLVGRCRERVKQCPTLQPLLEDSMVQDWYREMEHTYAHCKGTGQV